jgi:AcrR family transcriptional regulator
MCPPPRAGIIHMTGPEIPFQRARSTEHREVRKRAIVEAVRTLLKTTDPLDLRMRPLASSVGISPSGIYRYFENIQSLLLHVHLCDFEDVVLGLEEDSKLELSDLDMFASAITKIFLKEPRFLSLFSLTPALYEREVSVEVLIEHKLNLFSLMQRGAEAFMRSGHFTRLEDALQAIGQMLAFALGLYPLANPSSPSKSALKHPDLTFLNLDMSVELKAGIYTILKGWIYVG